MGTPGIKEWLPLLDPDVVAEAILARAEETNPTAPDAFLPIPEPEPLPPSSLALELPFLNLPSTLELSPDELDRLEELNETVAQ